MDYLKNHCWCRDSNWGGHYDCCIIVSIDGYDEHDEEDYEKMFVTQSHFSQKQYDANKRVFTSMDYELEEEKLLSASMTEISLPSDEVMDWLQENVADGKSGEKMWCIGSKEYIATDGGSFSFFFQRRKDAMAFIARFSKWKKPVNYCQYFTDVRKTLDLTTLKYKKKV